MATKTFETFETSETENSLHVSEEENSIHEPEGEQKETHTGDDTGSTSSTASAARVVRQCPFCTKELQTRSMFKHIRLTHPYQMTMCADAHKVEEMKFIMEESTAFPFSFFLKNDFDEEEEHKIYGCFGCNNTFVTECKANTHCQKKTCSAKHKKAIKDMMKEEMERLKKKSRLPKRKTVEQFRDLLILEMRRYKHVQHVSGLLNEAVQFLLDKKDSYFSPADIIPNEETPDFTIPMSADDTQMETLLRKWSRKTVDLDSKFLTLRRKVFDYSVVNIDKFSCCCAENPKGLYVGSTNHDDLGPRMYPPF